MALSYSLIAVIKAPTKQITRYRFLRVACIFVCSIVITRYCQAQNDTLVFNNGDILVGEIKSLKNGVFVLKTSYSDTDFRIEWLEMEKISTQNHFLITLTDGRIYNGTLHSIDGDTILISHINDDTKVLNHEIIELESFEGGFLKRFSASIDISYSFTKANNFSQLGLQSNIEYQGRKWGGDFTYKMVLSEQESTEQIRRIDGNLMLRRLMPNLWYLPFNYSSLSNTEQAIDLRSNFRGGVGKYVLRKNQVHLAFESGVAYLNEFFSDDSPEKNSMELYLGSEYYVYGLGDLKLLTRIVMSPSVTEKGRIRVDYTLDLKYDFPLDLYIKSGLTLNYDNQSVIEGSKTDYVVLAGFGWEFN